MYRTSHMFEAASPAFLHIKKKIESLKGVESVDVGEEGGLDVILEGGVNQSLRESVLDIGRRSMIPCSGGVPNVERSRVRGVQRDQERVGR